MLDWNWMGRQFGRVSLAVIVLYAVVLGGTLTGLALFTLRVYTLALLAFFGGLWLVRGQRRASLPPFVLPLLGMCVAVAVATLFSSDPRRSLTQLSYFAGLTLAHWLVADGVQGRENELGWVLLGIVVVIVGAALPETYRLWLASGKVLATPYVRPSSVMGSANILATSLLVSVPLVVNRAITVSSALWRGLLAVLLLCVVGMLLLAGSRGALLGVGLGGVAFALIALHGNNLLSVRELRDRWRTVSWMRRVAFAMATVAIVAALAALVPFVIARSSGVLISNRLDLWQTAWQQFMQTPLTGRGPFTYGDAYLEQVSVPPKVVHAHSHNLILNVAAEDGLLGLLGLAGLVIAGWRMVSRQWGSAHPSQRTVRALAGALIIGVAVHNMVDVTLVPGVSLFALWTLLVLEPERVDGFWPDGGARLVRRWGGPILWVSVVLLWAFPLPGAAAAAKGRDAANRGDWLIAASHYQQAIERDPGMAIYRFFEAHSYAQAAVAGDESQLPEAIERYEATLVMRPEYAVGWANLAILKYQSGQMAEAANHMQEAGARAPRSAILIAYANWMGGEGARPQDVDAVFDPPAINIAYALHDYHVPGPPLDLLPLPDGS